MPLRKSLVQYSFVLRTLLLAVCGFVGQALAADPVLYMDDDSKRAVLLVASATGRSPDGFRAVHLMDTVAAEPPVLLGQGSIDICQGRPTSMAQVVGALMHAEKAYRSEEYEVIVRSLARAEDAMGCLGEPIDATKSARLFLLGAVAEHHRGKTQAARDGLKRALALDVDIPWDDAFPDDLRPVFEGLQRALKAERVLTLHVVPGPEEGGARLDGRVVDAPDGWLMIPPGRHLVQLGQRDLFTFWVTLPAGGGGAVTIPGLLPPDSISWIADPSHRRTFSHVLSAVFGRGTTVFVYDNGDVWRGKAGTGAWQLLTETQGPAVTAVVSDADRAKAEAALEAFRGAVGEVAQEDSAVSGAVVAAPDAATASVVDGSFSSGPRPILWVGGGAFLGGAAVAAVSYLQAAEYAEIAGESENWYDYQVALAANQAAERRLWLGEGLAVGGVVAVGLGVALDLGGGLTLAPQVGAPGLALRWVAP